MRTALVAVADVATGHSSEVSLVHDWEVPRSRLVRCPSSTMERQSVRSDRTGLTQRPTMALALGARTGVRTTLAPSPWHTASKLGPNFPSWSRRRYLTERPSLAQILGHVAGALGHPLPGGARHDAGKEDPSRAVMNEERQVKAAQRDRVDGEEVAGHDAAACWWGNPRQVADARRGPGSRP